MGCNGPMKIQRCEREWQVLSVGPPDFTELKRYQSLKFGSGYTSVIMMRISGTSTVCLLPLSDLPLYLLSQGHCWSYQQVFISFSGFRTHISDTDLMSTVLDQHSVPHGFPEWEGEAEGKGAIACVDVSKKQFGQCQLAKTRTAPNIGTKSITWGCLEVTCCIIFSTSLAKGNVLSLMGHVLNS